MATKRTQEEINNQIEGLKKMKTSLPEFTFFGDNNWSKISAQIDVLEGKCTSKDFEDEEDEEDDVYLAAMDAEDWLDGFTDEDLFEL